MAPFGDLLSTAHRTRILRLSGPESAAHAHTVARTNLSQRSQTIPAYSGDLQPSAETLNITSYQLQFYHGLRPAVPNCNSDESIKRFHAGRKYTSRKQHLARADRERFPGIISIDETTYDFALTSAFTDAIDGAARDADAHHARHTPNAM